MKQFNCATLVNCTGLPIYVKTSKGNIGTVTELVLSYTTDMCKDWEIPLVSNLLNYAVDLSELYLQDPETGNKYNVEFLPREMVDDPVPIIENCEVQLGSKSFPIKFENLEVLTQLTIRLRQGSDIVQHTFDVEDAVQIMEIYKSYNYSFELV